MRDIAGRIRGSAQSDTYGGAPVRGRMIYSPVRLLWFAAMAIPAAILGPLTAAPGPIALWLGLSVLTLCGGHSLGMHRWLIHESFACPQWLGVFGVWLATLVGLGGPLTMMRAHDLRDWAQRQSACHPFFSQHAPILRDTARQMGARFIVTSAATFEPSGRYQESPSLQWLQRTAMLQNLGLAVLLYWWGGLAFVVWGVCVRVTVSMLGHSLVGWFAHRQGPHYFHVEGAAVQGRDVPGPRGVFGLLTFGECWHNNHHAFPESAKLGLRSGQWDPGWWVLQGLRRVGLVWDVVEADACGAAVPAE